MILETYMQLCVKELNFLEKFFLPPDLGNGSKMAQKQGFLNLLKNLVISLIFEWTRSKMGVTIYFVPEARKFAVS